VKANPVYCQCNWAAKSESRNPNPERRPKLEVRTHEARRDYEGGLGRSAVSCQPRPLSGPDARTACGLFRISDFGLLSDFGLRTSDFSRPGLIRAQVGRTLTLWLTLVLFGLAATLLAQQPAIEEGRSRFRAVEIYVDSGSTPLAAYQLQFAATNGVARIVGIEGGEHPAFRQPPFYDPKAIQHERVIIASFSTAPAADLPTGKTRVATIHYQTTDTQPPRFELKLQTAGDTHGNKISAQPSFEERKPQ
jgi:hypothetical protein